jgi:predicted nucleic acid-binding protein
VAAFTALFDANVLYPSELRIFLLHLVLSGLFRAKWTAEILEEWIAAVLAKRPDLSQNKLARTRALMDEHAIDALVTGYEALIPSLQLPDPNDRHVLAAAIRARADVIVTANLRDFPAGLLAPLAMEAQHPDEFVLHLLDLSPTLVVKAAQDHRQSLKNPAMSVEAYLTALERQGLTQTVSMLREYIF